MKINMKKFIRAEVVIIILTSALAVLIAYGIVNLTGHKIVSKDYLRKKDAKIAKHEKIYDIQSKINKEYLFSADETVENDSMLKALVSSLGDKYSEYMTEDEVKAWEDAVNSGFTGIGITFNVADGRAEILSVAEDGPADAAELKEGDVIKAVNGKEFETESDFLKAISGKPGKTLKLEVLRGWYTFEANVTIADVKMRAVSSKVIDKDTGYIRITSFSKNSAEEFSAELKSLNEKQVKTLIVDLRDNGGGYVDQGIKICDMLLPECTIGYLEDKNGKRKTFNSDEESCGLKLAVLINEKSASASEIVAAAVKDNKAGITVGRKTYGKGLSQTEFKFKDGSALKLTTAQYLTPSEKTLDGKGVTPDYKIGKGDDGEDKDKQLDKAVELLK